MNVPPASRISLEVPATPPSLRYARVVAATVADDAGFDVARIESLRLAVDELCAIAVDVAPGGAALSLSFWTDDSTFGMEGSCGPVTDEPLVDPIAEQLLTSVTAHHDVTVVDGTCRISMRCSA